MIFLFLCSSYHSAYFLYNKIYYPVLEWFCFLFFSFAGELLEDDYCFIHFITLKNSVCRKQGLSKWNPQEPWWGRVGLGSCTGKWEWSNTGTGASVVSLSSEKQQLHFDLKKQNFQASTVVGSFWCHSQWSLPPAIRANAFWVWAGPQDSFLTIKYGGSECMSKGYGVHASSTLFCWHSLPSWLLVCCHLVRRGPHGKGSREASDEQLARHSRPHSKSLWKTKITNNHVKWTKK